MTAFALHRLPRSRDAYRTCANKCAAPGSGLRNAAKLGVFLDTFCAPHALPLCSRCAREWAATWQREVEALASTEECARAKMPSTAQTRGAGRRRANTAGPQNHQETRVPDAAPRKDMGAVADLSGGAADTVLIRPADLRRPLGAARVRELVPAGASLVRAARLFRDVRAGRMQLRVGDAECVVPLAAALDGEEAA